MLRSREPAAVRTSAADTTGGGGLDEDSADDRREAAALAGRRIGADLDNTDGARPLSGRLGAAALDVVLPREITRVWPLIATWTSRTCPGRTTPSSAISSA